MKQQVNFIKHWLAAHEMLMENVGANYYHVCLYDALFIQWNNLGFPEVMKISSGAMMAQAKISNRNIYSRTIKELESFGMLVYTASFNKNVGSTIILQRLDTGYDTGSGTRYGTGYDIGSGIGIDTGSGTGIDTGSGTYNTNRKQETINSKLQTINDNSSANADSNIESEVSVFDSENVADYQTKPEFLKPSNSGELDSVEAKKEKPPVAKPPQQFDIRKHAPTKEFFEANGYEMPEQMIGDGRLQFLLMDWHWKQSAEKQTAAANVYETFLNWWTAKVQTGKKAEIGKELWETKPTFDIGGRVATFLKNNSKSNNQNSKYNESNKRNIGTVEQGKPADSIANADFDDYERDGWKVCKPAAID